MTKQPFQLDYAGRPPPPPPERYGKVAATFIGANAFASIWLIAIGLLSFDFGWMAGLVVVAGLLTAIATLGQLSRKEPRFRTAFLLVSLSLLLQIAAIALAYRKGEIASANLPTNIQSYNVSYMSDEMHEDAARGFLEIVTVCTGVLAMPLWLFTVGKLFAPSDTRSPGQSDPDAPC